MKPKLLINILTSRSLIGKEEGHELLRLWLDKLPDYSPEHFGNWEPLRSPFKADGLDTVLEHWEWPFLVKRRKPRMDGSVFMAGGADSKHGWIHIVLEFQRAREAAIISFFKSVATQFSADFGFLHMVPSDIRLGVTTHELRRALPDFYWATILGPPYSKMFGRERVTSVPARFVEELSSDLYYLQTSDELLDLQNRSSEFSLARTRIKSHLNSNAFFDPTLDPDHVYSVPEFHFQRTADDREV